MKKAISERFQFSCTCCGDCCSGDMKITINLYDLYKISRFLKKESSALLIKEQLIQLVKGQNDVWLPQIRFKTKPFSFCPWMINDLGVDNVLRGFCSLHPDHKPLVCKLAPIGKTIDLAEDSVEWFLTSPTENCPGMNGTESHSLEEIANKLKEELEYERRFFQLLESIKPENLNSQMMESVIYTFDTQKSFESILLELENRYE